MIGSALLLGFVIAERLVELWLAQRNTVALMARGASEHAAWQYLPIVLMHGAWLIGLCLLGWNRAMNPGWLAAFALLQVLRVWVMVTLGKRFTTRVITVPGEVLVTGGLYRFTRHPNYLIVIGEIAVLPLVFGLWEYALLFSILNGIALFFRIRAEDRALEPLRHG